MRNEIIYDRIRGALYGVAVGDALGAPLEFMSADAIKKAHGCVTEMIGGGWLQVQPGEVTDDTQMTLAVARGIVACPEMPIPYIGHNFINWYESEPKYVESICAHAITLAISGSAVSHKDWMAVGECTHKELSGQTKSDGALMRTIYPAVYYPDALQREGVVKAISAMTHFSQESRDICVEYAHAVHAAIFGGHPISTITKAYYKPDAAPSGYVVDTWSNVIDAILYTETFEEAVVNAVNRGGDVDNIGAITGGLAGAYYGYTAIPDRWLDYMDDDLKAELDELAERAYTATEEYYRDAFKLKYKPEYEV